MGQQRVPTLRNVDRRPDPGFVKAYAFNGFFETLDGIVHFHNTRDVEEWRDPEASENVNDEEIGDRGLSAEEEALIVPFMSKLSDGYEAP